MNYFSHFVFDHYPNNYEYNTGLLLPDITRKYISKFRILDSNLELPDYHYQFLNGCLKHYESDKKFHSSFFFNQNYKRLNNLISNSQSLKNVERKWFISHIIFELLIDRIIVNYQRTLLDEFYFSLLNVDEFSLATFLGYYGMKDFDKFFNFFNHFRNTQYIYHYTDNNKFMYSLNRIMMRANVKELSQSDSEIILKIMLEFEQNYLNNPILMIEEIREILK